MTKLIIKNISIENYMDPINLMYIHRGEINTVSKKKTSNHYIKLSLKESF